MGCNSLECITPMSSPLFFGSPSNTQESRHITLSPPEHKGKHLSLVFGLQRLIGSLHITRGKCLLGSLLAYTVDAGFID